MNATIDPWQFALLPAAAVGLEANAWAFGGFALQTGSGLTLSRLHDAAGKTIGFLWGMAFDLEQKCAIAADHHFSFSLSEVADSVGNRVSETLCGFWLFFDETTNRIYPDPMGGLACVFDRTARTVGSSAHTLLFERDYEVRFRENLHMLLDVKREGFFPGGLTAHVGIDRLLPNHYLDLADFTVHRFWPDANIPVQADVDLVSDKLSDHIREQVRLFASRPENLSLALTGGGETRAILSCVKDMITNVQFVTVTGPDVHARDSFIAERLAKTFALRWRPLPRQTATASQAQTFLRRAGHVIGDSNVHYHPSVAPLGNGALFAGGLGGEVGRAFLWRAADQADSQISAATLQWRLGLPHEPECKAAIDRWREGVKDFDAFNILDLAYIENRMGTWSSPQVYGDPTVKRLALFSSRKAVRMLMSLPPEVKRSDAFMRHMVRRNWPELLAIPINRWGNYRDHLEKLRRAIRNPAVIRKKLRKLLS